MSFGSEWTKILTEGKPLTPELVACAKMKAREMREEAHRLSAEADWLDTACTSSWPHRVQPRDGMPHPGIVAFLTEAVAEELAAACRENRGLHLDDETVMRLQHVVQYDAERRMNGSAEADTLLVEYTTKVLNEAVARRLIPTMVAQKRKKP